MAPEHLAVMDHLRDFMFERVYLSPEAEAQKVRAVQVIGDLVNYYQEMPGEVPEGLEGSNPLAAIDYVAGMTDRFALNTWDTLFRPTLNL
jgi:dGTPase